MEMPPLTASAAPQNATAAAVVPVLERRRRARAAGEAPAAPFPPQRASAPPRRPLILRSGAHRERRRRRGGGGGSPHCGRPPGPLQPGTQSRAALPPPPSPPPPPPLSPLHAAPAPPFAPTPRSQRRPTAVGQECSPGAGARHPSLRPPPCIAPQCPASPRTLQPHPGPRPAHRTRARTVVTPGAASQVLERQGGVSAAAAAAAAAANRDAQALRRDAMPRAWSAERHTKYSSLSWHSTSFVWRRRPGVSASGPRGTITSCSSCLGRLSNRDSVSRSSASAGWSLATCAFARCEAWAGAPAVRTRAGVSAAFLENPQ